MCAPAADSHVLALPACQPRAWSSHPGTLWRNQECALYQGNLRTESRGGNGVQCVTGEKAAGDNRRERRVAVASPSPPAGAAAVRTVRFRSNPGPAPGRGEEESRMFPR